MVKLLKSAHNDYLNDVVGGSLDKNPKRFWSYIKHSWTETIGIPTLRHGEPIYISDKEKAEALNDYFQSIFTKDNGLLTTCTSDNMSDIVFSHNGVLKQLATLNPSKSAGLDSISSCWLRDLSTEISSMLTYIFQQSYHMATLPSDWLTAVVVPVHKKSSKDNPANYWPISLTCLCCKVMEHIVLSNLNRHLSDNNILSPLQHGLQTCPVKLN